MILLRRVEGDSMEPTLKNGQFVLAYNSRKFRPGQVVVAFMDGREVIKRIASIEQGKVYLVGDNQGRSTDSRTLGKIGDQYIEGVVFWPNVYKKLD